MSDEQPPVDDRPVPPSGDAGDLGGSETQRMGAPPTEILRRHPRAGRDLKIAIATGLALAALVIALLFAGPTYFFALAFVVILVAQVEFYAAARRAGHDPAGALGVMGGALMLIGVYTRGERAVGLVLFLTLLFSFVWYMAMERRAHIVTDISITLFGLVYVPMLGSIAGLLAKGCRTPDGCPPRGGGLVLTMIGLAALYDVFAYAGGTFFGKTPLAPNISPKKTREGALAASVGIILVAMVGAPLLGPWEFGHALVLGVLVCVAAPLGDLVESLLKRDLGIKDMGTVFPGHGGALDRIDAVLFVAPAVYLSLVLIGYMDVTG